MNVTSIKKEKGKKNGSMLNYDVRCLKDQMVTSTP